MLQPNNLKETTLKNAQDSKSLTLGTSPFIKGQTFTITDYSYEKIGDGENENAYPVFVTTLGNLSVNSLLRAKAIKPYEDPKTHEMIMSKQPSGTFHTFLRQVLADNRGKTNDEVLQILVEKCKDLKLVVRDREYVTVETRYGDKAVPMAHIDIVE